jgi:adenylate cyclase
VHFNTSVELPARGWQRICWHFVTSPTHGRKPFVYVGAVARESDERDVEALGLLDGLHGQARTERRELIEWLLERGFSIGQIRGALSPMVLPADRVIGDDRTLASAREIADGTGVPLDLLQQLHRAAGLVRVQDPDTRLASRADAESVVLAARLIDLGFAPEYVVAFVRLVMDGLTRAAATMRRAALKTLLRPGATELQLARDLESLAQQAEPLLGPIMNDLMRLALRQSFETEAINAAERAAGTLPGSRAVGIAFADLVGFTRLGEQLPPEDLGLVAERLNHLTREVVASPVHFIKTLGDAVMLVCPDPLQLLRVVLDLVEVAASVDLPPLRAGLAFGHSVNRAGDWYGSPVNLASRVASAAPAGAVRVSESARVAMGEAPDIRWSLVGARHFKNVRGEVLIYDAHRSDMKLSADEQQASDGGPATSEADQ